MTITEFIRICRQNFPRVDICYAHPSLYILCVDPVFEEWDADGRDFYFMEKIDGSVDEMAVLQSAAGVVVELCTPEERNKNYDFLEAEGVTSHWLPLLDRVTRKSMPHAAKKAIPAIHFYGFKGGQARSTILAMLAKSLAADNYRVLLVDADVEAPSLDLLFDISADGVESTLMGLSGWSEVFTPLSAFGSTLSRGAIDLIPCRPRSESYDMDFAAFTIKVALDSGTLKQAIRRLTDYLGNLDPENSYDVVIFDHRTGIAPSVIPAIHEWPGAVVVAARPDGLSMQAQNAFATLFSIFPENPGVFVSFSLDPEESQNTMLQRAGKEIQSLLEELASAIAKGAEAVDPLPPEAMLQYWVPWFADPALFTNVSPSYERLSSDNRNSIRQLREVIGFEDVLAPQINIAVENLPGVSSPSGSIDSGWFIETPEISRLFLPKSSISYIVGRKGTGKTRLFREMAERKIGEPIFSAADFIGRGVKSQGTTQSLLMHACDNNFRRFWWALLTISLKISEDASELAFDAAINEWCEQEAQVRVEQSTSHFVVKTFGHLAVKRNFLIDGIETAVASSELKQFIEELLFFMLTIQSDSKLSGLAFVRLFLRTDLLRNASENVEQQTSQRKLELKWDSNSIFNFALSRIELAPWFKLKFPEACEKIRDNGSEIRAGKLARSEYIPILHLIFPKKLRRNNIQTITFFETYFSDASGDSKDGASFYPRLYENFLRKVGEIASAKLNALEEGRISHDIVLDAHSAASDEFMDEVTSELYYLIQLDSDAEQNRKYIRAMLKAMDGLTTPFIVNDRVKELDALLEMGGTKIRDAMQNMREVGIFDNRPDYPGQWRAGRLYKTALRMKYVR